MSFLSLLGLKHKSPSKRIKNKILFSESKKKVFVPRYVFREFKTVDLLDFRYKGWR